MLELLTEKWCGSTAQMYDFADQVAADAPAGRPAHAAARRGPRTHGDRRTRRCRRRPGTPGAIDLAINWLATAGDLGHHVVAEHQNTLVFVLFHLERFRQAYEALLAVGPYATTRPWGYYGDAREVFLSYREAVVATTAETV